MKSIPHILIIGCGSIGERHVRCFLRTGRVTVGVCEIHAALRDRMGSAYHVAACFETLERALRQSWDAAVIATPAMSHVPIARRLVESRIATLIEKPLAVTEDGFTELATLSESLGVMIGVAYVYRAHPALEALRTAIQEGRFGRVLQVVVQAGQHFPTYRPIYANTYYADRASGGGAVQDALTHLINAVEWVVGPTGSVIADAAHLALPDVEVEDTVHVLARHGSVMAAYTLNQHQAPNEVTLSFNCERGVARFELHRHRWRWMTRPDTPWTDEPADLADRDAWFTAQAGQWLDAVEGRTPPRCTLREAWHTLRACRAILESSTDGSRRVIALETRP